MHRDVLTLEKNISAYVLQIDDAAAKLNFQVDKRAISCWSFCSVTTQSAACEVYSKCYGTL